jgi:hypothetical protein
MCFHTCLLSLCVSIVIVPDNDRVMCVLTYSQAIYHLLECSQELFNLTPKPRLRRIEPLLKQDLIRQFTAR